MHMDFALDCIWSYREQKLKYETFQIFQILNVHLNTLRMLFLKLL